MTSEEKVSVIDWFRVRNGWHGMIIAGFALLTYVTGLSIYSPPPIKPADVVIFVEHPTPDATVMTEVRSVVGMSVGETIYVSRHIYREGYPNDFLVLEAGNFRTFKGEFPIVHTMPLPKWVVGRWCSSVTYTWWPSWSQREFSLEAQDVCFETTEYE